MMIYTLEHLLKILAVHLEPLYIEHFIFFVTYDWDQYAGDVPGKSFQPSIM
jgi:hypothetical protein